MSGVSSNHVLAHSVIEFAREHVEKENTLIRGGVVYAQSKCIVSVSLRVNLSRKRTH
jgi:hypothetical protein